jgi:hypothetical protein
MSAAAVSASSVEVSTVDFEFAHGRKPRGHGMWGFYFGFSRRNVVQEPVFFTASYAAAKRQAVAAAAARGFTHVEVGS